MLLRIKFDLQFAVFGFFYLLCLFFKASSSWSFVLVVSIFGYFERQWPGNIFLIIDSLDNIIYLGHIQFAGIFIEFSFNDLALLPIVPLIGRSDGGFNRF